MIALRPVEKKDDSFIESVYRSTREDELKLTNWPEQQKQAFVHMQLMMQLSEFKEKYPGAFYQIVMYKKKPAGRFYIRESENEILLMEISLLPQFRNKGIGTYLIEEAIKKSVALNKKVSLHVKQGNPAFNLYRRLGFVHIKMNGNHFYMERKPDQ